MENAPRLIPIFGHRYLPAEPEIAGNPVFSVYQTDIIYYGVDLRRYLSCEFGGLDYALANRDEPRRIRFWADLVEDNLRAAEHALSLVTGTPIPFNRSNRARRPERQSRRGSLQWQVTP
jgi:hypothetical protein